MISQSLCPCKGYYALLTVATAELAHAPLPDHSRFCSKIIYSPGHRHQAALRATLKHVEWVTGGYEGGVPPSWGAYEGAGPLCKSWRGRHQSRCQRGNPFDQGQQHLSHEL